MKMRKTWPLKVLQGKAIMLPLKLLTVRDRYLLAGVIVIFIFLALLDLFGVLLIGVIGSLSITGVSSNQTGDRVSMVLSFLQLETYSFDKQVVAVGVLASIMLVSKTLISLVLIRRTLFFMARRGAYMSADLVKKYFMIPVSSITQRSVQTSIYALTEGVSRIMVGVIGTSVSLISDLLLLLVMAIGLFLVDPITALSLALIFGFLAFVLYKNMHEKMSVLGESQGKLSIESSQRIFEAISSYRELLVKNRRGFYAKQIGQLRFKLANGNATIAFMSNMTKYILEITLVFSALLLAFYQFSTTTAFRAIATITVFIAASSRIVPAILRLQQGLLGMKAALAEARPTLSLIEEISDITADDFQVSPLSQIHLGFKPSIEVSNVTFAYDGNNPVLKAIDFVANPGEFIAIVGGSGAGKTTLVDTILGALDAQAGEVKISGQPPRETFSTWPGAVSYVPQDSPIIDGSIRENLGLGFPTDEVLDQYCWESLKIARLDSFVKDLPNQLETKVGDRGTRLSGGQRQRLGIARALITRPKLLILDEATSSLDGVIEYEISEALQDLKGEMTLIVIAHRLSTVVGADRLYFLQEGAVEGVGTFSELKVKNPEFLAQAELMGL